MSLGRAGRGESGGSEVVHQSVAVHACYGAIGSGLGAGGGPHQDERYGGSQASTVILNMYDKAVVAASVPPA